MAVFGRKKQQQEEPAKGQVVEAGQALEEEKDVEEEIPTSGPGFLGLADDEGSTDSPDSGSLNEGSDAGLDDDLLDIFTGEDGINEELRLLTEGLPQLSMQEVVQSLREVHALVRERAGY